jgi:general secretion pathway protein E
MKSILKTFIDYSLFEKYDKEYFLENKIIPIYEDNIYLKVVGMCIKSRGNI